MVIGTAKTEEVWQTRAQYNVIKIPYFIVTIVSKITSKPLLIENVLFKITYRVFVLYFPNSWTMKP